MRTTTFVTLFVLHASLLSKLVAQNDTTNYYVETGGLASTSSQTPFWLRANQFGTVPLQNPFAFVRTGGQTVLGKNPRKAQLQLQAEIVANLGKTSQLILPAAAATFRYRRFEAYVGRRKEFFGLGDTLLTSGSYAWSGNALPLPKVQVGTRGFVPLGFTKGLLAFHATFSHGWFGKQDSVQGSYLHQKIFYGRLGKPKWKVKFYLGLIHNVQWGGELTNKSATLDLIATSDGTYPSSFKDYLFLLRAREPKGRNYAYIDSLNQIGNHLGSIDLGMEISCKKWNIFIYHQHPYEDKSGLVFINFPDGLYGLRLKNIDKTQVRNFRIQQATLEYLTTMDRGLYAREDLRKRYDPDEYFYHAQYIDGWAYNQYIIGTSFITRYLDTRSELTDPNLKADKTKPQMINNYRGVSVFYCSLLGTFKNGVKIETKLSHSHNLVFYNWSQPINKVNQLSGIFRATFPLNWHKGYVLQTAISFDQGGLYYNSFGSIISLRKMW